MPDDKSPLLPGDFGDAVNRTLGRVREATMRPVPPAGAPGPVLGDALGHGPPLTSLDAVAHAAAQFLGAWDAARVLGFATSDGAAVPVVLARINELRLALSVLRS